jgi:two-component system, cell cycle sensor histidine kinase and response regulator CckA
LTPSGNIDPKQLDGRILIVEDDEGVCKFLSRILSVSSATLEIATTGKGGLELFCQHQDIRLVILDLSLPDLGGLDVLAEIRKSSVSLPVVISSGFEEEIIESQLKEDPYLRFLHKPYRIDKFWSVLESAISEK